MPDEQIQQVYDELNRRGIFKGNEQAAAIGHELRRRGVVSDPTQGGIESSPAAQVSGQMKGMDPDFSSRLNQMIQASGGRLSITDGFRTSAQQADAYRRKPNLAAPPGHSLHEKGLAADLAGDLDWAHANGERFGLVFPMLDPHGKKFEPWHVQPANYASKQPAKVSNPGLQPPPQYDAVNQAVQARPTQLPNPSTPTDDQLNQYRMDFFNTNNMRTDAGKANIPMALAVSLAKNPKDPVAQELYRRQSPVGQVAIAQKAKELTAEFSQEFAPSAGEGATVMLRDKGTGKTSIAPPSQQIAASVRGPEGAQQLQQAKGFGPSAERFAYSLSDPENIAIAGLAGAGGILAPALAPVISGGFAGMAGKQAIDKYQAGDPGGAAFDALLGVAAGAHAVKGAGETIGAVRNAGDVATPNLSEGLYSRRGGAAEAPVEPAPVTPPERFTLRGITYELAKDEAGKPVLGKNGKPSFQIVPPELEARTAVPDQTSEIPTGATPAPPAELPGPTSPGIASETVTGTVSEVPPNTTSARMADMARDRAALDLPELPAAERKSWAQSLAKAQERGLPQEANGLAKAVLDKPRALNDEETAGLVLRAQEIKNKVDTLHQEAAAATDEGRLSEIRQQQSTFQEEFDTLSSALKKSGTEKGRALASQKLTIDKDYSIVNVKSRLKLANPEKPLTPHEDARVTELSSRLQQAEERIKDLETQRVIRKMAREEGVAVRQSKRRASREQLNTEYRSLRDEFISKASKMSAGLDPELAVIAGKMAKNLVKQGVVEAHGIVEGIYNDLKDHVEGLDRRTLRDAISGYGKLPDNLSPEAKSLSDARALMRRISKLEDVMKGEKPVKGKAPEMSPAVRAIEKDIASMMKATGLADKPASKTATGFPRTVDQRVQANKTRIANEIRDLDRRIAQNDTSAKYRQALPDDAALTALKTQRDALKSKFNTLKGVPAPRTITEAQKAKFVEGNLKRSIQDLERRIAEKDFSKREISPVTNPAIEQMKAQREKLKAQYYAMKPPAEQVRRQLTDAQRLKMYKANLMRAISAYEERLKTGNLDKPPVRTTPLDAEARQMQRQRDALRHEIDTMIASREKPHWTDYVTRWQRMSILSGVTTLGKLGAAAAGRIAETPLEEIIGGTLSRTRLGKAAAREGTFSPAAEAKALTEAFSKMTLSDMVQKIRTGSHSLDAQFGKAYPHHPILDFFGTLHGALKTPAQRGEFFRAFEKRAQHAARNGADLADPEVQLEIGAQAYADSKRAILMGENGATKAYRVLIAAVEQQGQGGKVSAAVIKSLLPIVSVPTNYVTEAANFVAGGPIGVARIILNGGIDKLTPEQADMVLRSFKKQGVGMGLLAIGYLQPNGVKFGGYYAKGDKARRDLKPGEISLFGHTLPHWASHTPALEALQVGASFRRAMDYTKDSKSGKLLAGAHRAASGLIEEIPFADQAIRVGRALESPSEAGKFAGQYARGMAIPQLAQQAARFTDRNSRGEVVRRKPRGFVDTLKEGTPGLRQQVPVPQSR